MDGDATHAKARDTIEPDEVLAFRQGMLANGYFPIRIHSGTKKPVGTGWPDGEHFDVLMRITPGTMNTGLITAGLRCIDVDVDDQALANEIAGLWKAHLPQDGLIRHRHGSARYAVLYRAETGELPKRSINGSRGKIEILGKGQYLFCHGVHPDGARLTWMGERGPDTVPRDQLPIVSEAQITSFLEAAALCIGATLDQAAWPNRSRDPKVVEANRELSAGIEPFRWFELISPEDQSSLVKACFDVLDNSHDDPRERWLHALFAAAHAGELGCADAHQHAMEWSRRGASWTSEADFDKAWSSYKPEPGGITIGTLLKMARNARLDLSSWRNAARHRGNTFEWTDVGRNGLPKATFRNAMDAVQALSLTCQHDTFHRRKLIAGHPVGRFAGEISEDALVALRAAVVAAFRFDPGKSTFSMPLSRSALRTVSTRYVAGWIASNGMATLVWITGWSCTPMQKTIH